MRDLSSPLSFIDWCIQLVIVFSRSITRGERGVERRSSSSESIFSQRGAGTGSALNNRRTRQLNYKFFFMKASGAIQGHTHTDIRDRIIIELQQMNEVNQEVIEAIETLQKVVVSEMTSPTSLPSVLPSTRTLSSSSPETSA